MQKLCVITATALIFLGLLISQSSGHGAELRRDAQVFYAFVDGTPLAFDIYSTADVDAEATLPMIVFVHGGGWMAGTRHDIPEEMIGFAMRGFIVASIDYRKARYAKFPACVHDVKAAMRFLRANALRFRGDPDRIALVGFAAGGHLAMLAGLAGADLEGDVGDHDAVSSVPQAIVSFHGPTNLTTLLVQPTPGGMGRHRPSVELLLGGSPESRGNLARLASPVEHVHRECPPLLMFHGDADEQVPLAQVREMQTAYQRSGEVVEVIVAAGAGHRSLKRFDETRSAAMRAFLDKHLRVLEETAP